MNMQTTNGMCLYRPDGGRKYLNGDERIRFLRAAYSAGGHTQSLCLVLLYTGCRISEALSLSIASVQPSSGVVSIRSLKKRHRLHIREVPVPGELITVLDEIHAIRFRHRNISETTAPLWTWGRTTAWDRVKQVMREADISGPYASPKGLRHGFGVHAVQSGIPLNLVQKWLGHANMATTAIYTNAVGPEETAIAARMW